MKRNIFEAIGSSSKDSSAFDKVFNKAYRSHLDNTSQEVEKLFPTELSDNGQRYIEMLMSSQLDALIAKLEKLTGTKANTSQMAVTQLAFNAFSKISQLENGHQQELAQAAVEVILELPEYKMIKDLVSLGHLKIDAQIITPNLKGALQQWENNKKSEEVPKNDLSDSESEDFELMQELLNDARAKRHFIDYITQGAAVNAWDIYHLAADTIKSINPQLMELYPVFTTSVHTLYFMRGLMDVSGMAGGAVGMSSVDDEEEGGYTIRAHGVNFVVVLHELIKGIYDYIGLHGPEESSGSSINDEVYHLTGGGPLAKRFRENILKMLNGNVEMLLPVITKLYSEDASNEEIRDILNNKPNAKALVVRLAQEYQQALDDHMNHDQQSEYDNSWSPDSDDEY